MIEVLDPLSKTPGVRPSLSRCLKMSEMSE